MNALTCGDGESVSYFREHEVCCATEWTREHRAEIVTFLFVSAMKFDLHIETFLTSVNIANQLPLRGNIMSRRNGGRVCACLLIASKVEEVDSISVDDLYEGPISTSDILSCEQAVLEDINYRIRFPNILNFLPLHGHECITPLLEYMIFIGVAWKPFETYLPSTIAATIVGIISGVEPSHAGCYAEFAKAAAFLEGSPHCFNHGVRLQGKGREMFILTFKHRADPPLREQSE
jgi:hypothetical protein